MGWMSSDTSSTASASVSLARVRAALAAAGHPDTIATFPDGTRTAADAAAAIGCEVAQIAKSIVLRAGDRAVLAICSGPARVDASKVGLALGLEVASADAAFVREATGFAIGGVAPIGHLAPPLTVMDAELIKLSPIWAAAGTPRHVFRTEPETLARMTAAVVAAIRSIN